MWRSKDGRELIGRITEVDWENESVTMVRDDGIVFDDYPIKSFSDEDTSFLQTYR